jgi:hypothetical protein
VGLFKRNILGPAADAPSSGDGASDPRYDPMTGEKLPNYTGPVPVGQPSTVGQFDTDRGLADRFRTQARIHGGADLDADGGNGAGMSIGGR